MGITHSRRDTYVDAAPLLGAIVFIVGLFIKGREGEGPKATAPQNQPGEGGGGGGGGGGEENEPAPPILDIAMIAERINTYLQTNITNSHILSSAVCPTERQLIYAKERFRYTPGILHFAVTGTAGSGKSSLVNAFRGLRASDPGAAKTGVNETAIVAGRYPYPDQESPLARIVWYDIPGVGTQTSLSSSAYFNSQGLFIFDSIIVVTGGRFTERDLDIISHCRMHNIPSFVVRSKADTHIGNLQRVENCSYDVAQKRYTDETRKIFREQLGEAGLDCDTEIFFVSNEPLRDFVKSLMDGTVPMTTEALIDEHSLVENLLLTAQMRR